MYFRHGLGRTDYYVLNDPDLSFQEVLRKKVNFEASSNEQKDAIKLESPEDILKFDRNEILVKLEKGEGTLKIEKVAVKKDNPQELKDDVKKESTNKVELTLVKNDGNVESNEPVASEKPISETTEVSEKKEEEIKKDEPSETNVNEDKSDETPKIEEKKEEVVKEEEPPATETKQEESEKAEEPKKEIEEKPKAKLEEENDLCSKQAAELKAMFPDLEVIKPLSRLSQVDTFVLRDQKGTGALDFSETTVAQLLNNAVKWPKEYAIQVRLQHLIYAIETKEWPASKTFSAYASGIGNEFDIPIHELPNDPPKRDSSTPMSLGESEVITITTDNINRNVPSKKRKRHIAIDVETERAKLHALLNNSHGMHNPMSKHPSWDNDDSEDSRRSTPVSQIQLQPPPAHQHTSRLPYDLKYHVPTKTIGQTTVIPGTSSTLTPIDLSSG